MSLQEYPYDPTGVNKDNLILDEQHSVNEANYRDYYFIVPEAAPFHITNFKARWVHNGDVKELEEKKDFAFAIPSINGRNATGKLVYGAITIINPDIKNGIIAIDYQTIGGETIADRNYILTRIAERVYNPRLTTWENVTDKWSVYPPTEHPQDFDTFVGQKQLIDAILSIANKVTENNSQLGIVKHLLAIDNPHNTTKEQVGLSDVENLPVASLEEVIAPTPVRKYVTQDTLMTVLTGISSDTNEIEEAIRHIQELLNNHITNKDAHDIPLLKNAISSIQENVNANRTDLNTITNKLNQHIINTDNPHSTTKEQVGLGNVDNYLTATMDEVLNRDEIDKFVTLKHLVKYVNEFGGMGGGGSQYNLTATSSVVPEGESVFFTLNTPDEVEGNILYWTITHLTTKPSDFVEQHGSMQVIGNTAIFEIKTILDIDGEEDEFFAVRVRKDSIEGEVVAVSSTIKLTNVPSNAIYRIMTDRGRYEDNTELRINFDTTALPNGIVLYWNINHITSSPSDFKTNNGVIQIFNNHAQAITYINKATKDYDDKAFKIELRYGSTSGNIVASSSDLVINAKVGLFTLSTMCCEHNPYMKLTATNYYSLVNFIAARGNKRQLRNRLILPSHML